MIDAKQIAVDTVDIVFNAFTQFIVTGNIVEFDGNYNPTTGDTGGETLYPIAEIIFIDYEENKIDGQIIRSLDKKALFRVAEISIEITTEMILRLTGGDEWKIINIVKDPSNTLYELQSRRP